MVGSEVKKVDEVYYRFMMIEKSGRPVEVWAYGCDKIADFYQDGGKYGK